MANVCSVPPTGIIMKRTAIHVEMKVQAKKSALVKADYHERSLVYSTHKTENPAGKDSLFGVTSLYTRDSSISGPAADDANRATRSPTGVQK